MNSERSLAERHIDDPHDRLGDRTRIGIRRFERSQALEALLGQAGIRPLVVFFGAVLVGGRTGMGEVVGALREGARHDDRCFDSPTREFAGIADGQRVHCRLRSEIWREVRRHTATRAARRDPDDETATLFAQLRQRGPVDALDAEHVDVVELGELLGRERFGRAERHVAGIVDHDIDAARIGDDLRDADLNRCG
jgi:hypothetical protein